MIIFLEDFSQIGFGGGQRFTLAIIDCIRQKALDIQIFHLGSNVLFNQRLLSNKSIANNIHFKRASRDSSLLGRVLFLIALLRQLFFLKDSTIVSCTKFTTLSLAVLVQFVPKNRRNRYILFHHLVPPSQRLLKIIYSQLFKSPQFISVFPSKYLLNLYCDLFEFLHAKYVSPLPTISLPKRELTTSISPIQSNSRHFGPANLRFLYVGMIHPDKGIFRLLDFLSCFHSDQPSISFSLDIYGSGNPKYIQELVRLLSSLNFSASYYGSKIVTSCLYKEASCLFVPSWKHVETLCFTALEGIEYCSHNVLADNGVLSEYDIFENVTLSHDNPKSFTDALLVALTSNENKAVNRGKLDNSPYKAKVKMRFDTFWKNLILNS